MYDITHIYILSYDHSFLYELEELKFFNNLESLLLYVKENQINDYHIRKVELFNA